MRIRPGDRVSWRFGQSSACLGHVGIVLAVIYPQNSLSKNPEVKAFLKEKRQADSEYELIFPDKSDYPRLFIKGVSASEGMYFCPASDIVELVEREKAAIALSRVKELEATRNLEGVK